MTPHEPTPFVDMKVVRGMTISTAIVRCSCGWSSDTHGKLPPAWDEFRAHWSAESGVAAQPDPPPRKFVGHFSARGCSILMGDAA